MSEGLDKYDDGLNGVEKLVSRGKTRVDGEWRFLHCIGLPALWADGRPVCGLPGHGSGFSGIGLSRIRNHRTSEPLRREDARLLRFTKA